MRSLYRGCCCAHWSPRALAHLRRVNHVTYSGRRGREKRMRVRCTKAAPELLQESRGTTPETKGSRVMFIATILLLGSSIGGLGSDVPQDLPPGTTIQHQQDGTTWVFKPRGLDKMTVVDLRKADELTKRRYFAEFGSGLHDALILGRDDKSIRSACSNLVECARRVKETCAFIGSIGKKAKLSASNCEGECANGTSVLVVCAP